MELPTGVFADRVSRIQSVRLGILIITAGALLYSTAVGTMTAVVYEVIIGIGSAFINGAFSAWVKDALYARGEDDLYAATIADGAKYSYIALLVGGICGGFLGMWSLRSTWLVSGLIMAGSCLVVFRWMREERIVHPDRHVALGPLRASLNVLNTNRSLLWAIVTSVSFGLVLAFNLYWSPYFINHFGSVGNTLIWIPMNGTLAVSSTFVRRLVVKGKNESPALCSTILCSGIGLALMGAYPGIIWTVVCVMIHELGRGMFFPLLEIFTQRRVESAYRATYGSLQSFLTRIGNVTVLGVIWLCTRGSGWDDALIRRIWVTAGVLLICTSVLLWVFRPRTAQHA
jgi:hypothetical protein